MLIPLGSKYRKTLQARRSKNSLLIETPLLLLKEGMKNINKKLLALINKKIPLYILLYIKRDHIDEGVI